MVKTLSEAQEQCLFIAWCRMHPVLKKVVFSINNGGMSSVQWHAKRKKLGERPGVSDIFIPLPTKKYHGLWIEMKNKKGGVKSLEQVYWTNLMNELGYSAHFAHGFESAKNIAIEYLSDL
ncbi:MAG: hypothetical protein E6R13_03890 [Spirochaetes bacterium]|nr:MAG: hypothetical protein E6R13_03890 [Spirochaetota bacterium]